jgi:hypothetical protein|tara:strand:+ start:2611 stop:3000 length:390 start_codon:yes stop_codon:yes gene_type:complete
VRTDTKPFSGIGTTDLVANRKEDKAMPTVSSTKQSTDRNIRVSTEEITTFSNFTVMRIRTRTPKGDFEDKVAIVETKSMHKHDNPAEPHSISFPLNKPAPADVARLVQFIFGAGYRVGLGEAQEDLAVN